MKAFVVISKQGHRLRSQVGGPEFRIVCHGVNNDKITALPIEQQHTAFIHAISLQIDGRQRKDPKPDSK